eukprot:3626418-Pleurochrysis_carterae.AAC.1
MMVRLQTQEKRLINRSCLRQGGNEAETSNGRGREEVITWSIAALAAWAKDGNGLPNKGSQGAKGKMVAVG